MANLNLPFDDFADRADSLLSEFSAFIARGNIIDLAVGTIMGGAFASIVTSLVVDMITPVISLAMPSKGLKESYITLRCPDMGMCSFGSLKEATDAGAITLNWGMFTQAILTFIIISICIFAMLNIYAKAAVRIKRDLLRRQTIIKLPRMCRFCDIEVSKKATRCPHCTSQLGSDDTEKGPKKDQ